MLADNGADCVNRVVSRETLIPKASERSNNRLVV